MVLMVVVVVLSGAESLHACAFTTTQSTYTITEGTQVLPVMGTDDCFPPGTTVNVFLYTGSCGSGKPQIVSVVTDASSSFTATLSTSSLVPGTYCIELASPCNGSCTPPVNVTDSLMVTASETIASVNSTLTNSSVFTNSSVAVQVASSTQPVSAQLTGGGLLSQSTLLLVGVILVLVVVLLVVTFRRRKPPGPATSTGQGTDAIHCIECGYPNPPGNQFCRKCGAKLVKT